MTNGIIKIHGRDYATVAYRLAEFRKNHPIADGWGITTTVVAATPERVVCMATVVDPQGRTVATGLSELPRKNARTSPLETCETSAIGRALAAAGYGGDGAAYASADEMSAKGASPSWLDGFEWIDEPVSADSPSWSWRRMALEHQEGLARAMANGDEEQKARAGALIERIDNAAAESK